MRNLLEKLRFGPEAMVQAVQRWYHDAKVCMDFCGRSGQGARNQGTANLNRSLIQKFWHLYAFVNCEGTQCL
jgi:hypothetical protein